MKSIDCINSTILSLLVVAWCVIHSGMISVSVTEYLKKRLGANFKYYRAFFNLIAIVTLIPVVWFGYSVRTQVIFPWDGYLRIGQMLLLGGALVLFFLGMRHYDARHFLGIKQIRDGVSNQAITESGALDTSGVLGITRHPWYLATIFLIWGRPMDITAIVVNGILTVYLIVGIHLEEKKLIREFGEQYLAYQQKVSMLIPFMWLRAKILK